ncbi:MAG: response regulator transcription factor [Anaerolineae bacterium]|nr:response regulator transcription factor [Anaerolineae bacterium]
MRPLPPGADGFVLKQLGSDDLLKSIEAVGRGESTLDPATTTKVFAKCASKSASVRRAPSAN